MPTKPLENLTGKVKSACVVLKTAHTQRRKRRADVELREGILSLGVVSCAGHAPAVPRHCLHLVVAAVPLADSFHPSSASALLKQ